MKIGADIQDDIKRAAIIREEIGADGFLVTRYCAIYFYAYLDTEMRPNEAK